MSSIVNFAKRHKKKLIFLVIFFGGSYWSIKYVKRKIMEALLLSPSSFSNLSNEYFFRLKKQEHYLTIKQTSDKAVVDWIKSVLDKIEDSLSTKDLLEELKHKPPNKLEIWEKIKILSISKCLVTIYAISMLTLFFKIELNIIGAYLFLQYSAENSPNEIYDEEDEIKNIHNAPQNQDFILTPSLQQKYFQNIEIFVKKGLPNLISKMKNLCDESFKEISLKQVVTVDILNDIFEQIQNKIQYKYYQDSEKENEPTEDKNFNEFIFKNFVCEYLMFKDDKYQFSADFIEIELNDNKIEIDSICSSISKCENETLNDLNMETFDLLSSSDFQLVLSSLIRILTNEFFNNLTFQMVQQLVFPSDPNGQSEKIFIGLPFAKLIPILENYQANYENNQNLYEKVLGDPNLNIFSANIYESYSFTRLEETNDQIKFYMKNSS